jgi:hypothetical protein
MKPDSEIERDVKAELQWNPDLDAELSLNLGDGRGQAAAA